MNAVRKAIMHSGLAEVGARVSALSNYTAQLTQAQIGNGFA